MMEAHAAAGEFSTPIINDLPVSVSNYLPDGTLTYANEALARWAGISAAELVGKNLFEMLPGGEREQLQEFLSALSPQSPAETHEGSYRLPSGRVAYQQWTNRACFDADGALIRYQGIGVDLSDYRHWSAVEAEKQADFTALFESLDDMVVVCAKGGRMLFANAAVTKVLGYTPDELRSMTVHDGFLPAMRDAVVAMGAAALRGERLVNRLELLRKDGTLIPAESRIWTGLWGGEDCYFSIARNQSAERDAILRFETLFRQSPVLMALSDHTQRRFLDVNEAWADALGYTREEVIGKTAAELNLFACPRQRQRLLDTLLAKGKVVNEEYELRIKDGSIRHFLFSGYMLAGSGGNHLLTVLVDITARKQAEAQLYEAGEQLRQVIANVQEGVLVTGLDGRYQLWNPFMERFSGMSSVDVIGRIPLDLFPFLRDSTVIQSFERALAGEVSTNADFPYQVPDGRSGWFSEIVGPLRNTKGEITGTIATVHDVTERKKMEDRLRIKSRAVAQAINAIAISDLSANINYVNAAFLKLWCYDSEAEVLGRSIGEFWQPGARYEAAIYELRCGNSWKGELQGRRKDGTLFDVETQASLVTDDSGAPLCMMGIFEDITDRNKAAKALRVNEQRLSLTLEAVAEGVWDWNCQTGEVYYSPLWCRSLGYSPEEVPPRIEFWESILHPQDRTATKDALRSHMAGDTPHYYCENRLRTGTGQYRCNQAQGKVVEWDANGAALRMVGTDNDITSRKLAHEALLVSEERYRSLFETMASGVVYQAADGRITAANPAAEKILGLTHDQLLGKTSLDPEWKALREDGSPLPGHEHPSMMSLRTGQPYGPIVIGVFHPQTQSTRWLLVNAIPVFDPGQTVPHAVYTTFEDITVQKESEELVRESEERYRTLADAGQALIWTTGTDKKCDYFNQPWLSFTGRTAEQELGDGWAEGVHPEDLERCLKVNTEAFDRREPFSMIYRMRRYDGQYRWLQDAGKPRYDSHGNFLGYIGHCLDLTDRVDAEAERNVLHEQLAQAQKMESVGRLAGGVAHDFNNMLTVINGYSDLMALKLKPGDPLLRHLRPIREAGERAAGLTRQLLAFSRKQVLQMHRFDLNEVVKDLKPMIQRLVGEDVEVTACCYPAPLVINADPHQLEQVVMNLAVNARDAMPGGGRLTIETAGPSEAAKFLPLLSELPQGSYVMLSVCDSGTGMDEATQKRIFEPFYTTKGLGKGTGLGLSMVQGIVAQSGGHIGLRSVPGEGTTFYVFLPALAGSDVEVAAEESPAAGRGMETILVVEDEVDVLDYAAEVLQTYGYNVIKAATAGEALYVSERRKGPVDLVLTDVVMPNMNGQELADSLRHFQPGIKVLFMSGYTDDVVAQHGVLEKGLHFIEKPFTPEELARKIREVLGSPGVAHL